MSDNNKADLVKIIGGLLIILVLFGSLFVVANQRDKVMREAIQHGYAEYNATNGFWQWKPNVNR